MYAKGPYKRGKVRGGGFGGEKKEGSIEKNLWKEKVHRRETEDNKKKKQLTYVGELDEWKPVHRRNKNSRFAR